MTGDCHAQRVTPPKQFGGRLKLFENALGFPGGVPGSIYLHPEHRPPLFTSHFDSRFERLMAGTGGEAPGTPSSQRPERQSRKDVNYNVDVALKLALPFEATSKKVCGNEH